MLTILSVANDTLISVKQTVRLRLLPTPDQASALQATLSACNNAATWLSSQMHSAHVSHRFEVQKRFSLELRRRFGLSAQPAILVIRKTVAAYTTLRANMTAGTYGPPGSDRRRIPPSGREATVSIWTVAGRIRTLRFLGKPEHLRLLRSRTIGETDLIHQDGQWLLHAVVDATQVRDKPPVNGFVGVDLGIVNIATTSDGDRVSGSRLNRYRARQQRMRTRLRAKNTSSARRLLRNRRRKEARFATDLNHKISKNIVAVAERTGRGIAVERLTGIRARVRLRKPQRATLHSWAFGQLGEFLRYKATLSGLTLTQVDPAFTSQTCHPCGHVDKRSRRSQAKFICVRCGFVGHADHNAARNIAQRAVAGWGEIMRPDAAPTLASS